MTKSELRKYDSVPNVSFMTSVCHSGMYTEYAKTFKVTDMKKEDCLINAYQDNKKLKDIGIYLQEINFTIFIHAGAQWWNSHKAVAQKGD